MIPKLFQLFNFLIRLSTIVCADDNATKTVLVREEIATHRGPNLAEDTHPTIYAMVRGLADKAKVAMPRYISVYNAEYSTISDNGEFQRAPVNREVHEIKAYIDIMGDLHICREILTTLPYEDIEGVVAVAIAEKAINKPLKLAGTGVGTFGVTVAAAYLVNKHYGHKLGAVVRDTFDQQYTNRDRGDFVTTVCTLSMIPALLTTTLHSNNLQKTIDLDAAALTHSKKVIGGIKGLAKITDSLVKEGVLSRIATALNLKKIYRTLTYPIRSFTDEERIAYLEQEATH